MRLRKVSYAVDSPIIIAEATTAYSRDNIYIYIEIMKPK